MTMEAETSKKRTLTEGLEDEVHIKPNTLFSLLQTPQLILTSFVHNGKAICFALSLSISNTI